MRAARPALVLALSCTLLGTGAVHAATKPRPKPVCNLVKDAVGDASLQAPLPNEDALDIVSADVASNAKNFTAVIRVKDVSASGLNELGEELLMTFDLPGADAPVWIGYTSSAYSGDAFQYGLVGKGPGGATSPTGDAAGVVDTAKNEVRMTVPVADLSALGKAKPGAKVSHLAVTASQLVGVAPNASGVYGFDSEAVDEATGKAYVAGYPSCVTPPR